MGLVVHGMWDLPNPGVKPMSPDWQVDSLPLSHQEVLMVLVCVSLMISNIDFFFLLAPVGYLYIFSGKMSVQIVCLFFYLIFGFFLSLSCMNCLYILNINPLSIISFANIFFQLVGCLFILSVVSFAVQKLLT